MKVYSVKVNDFTKLTSNKSLLSTDQQEKLENYENMIVGNVIKFLPRGKDIILCITDNGKYYITAKPVYQASIVKILESVGIVDDDIKIVNRPTASGQDITIDQLKNILLK